MSDSMTSRISYYHAHLYYTDEQGLAAARELADQAERQFPLRVGRFHEKQVGPHPLWSCQLSFAPEEFGRIVPWLALNRGSLDIFVHVGTGDDRFDHTQGVMWLGNSHTLNLAAFDND
ncbi:MULTISPECIES: DOPA 4,5-dioxygenase family protein [Cobetia]|uniref:DOPA 4,5-dioxygenase family protein n=1 Tax=Cobetia TaxID=204286 RepID=UPI001581D789|nr:MULTISPECIES: DOPA 4,5-dioxygenase family protein [Cobetia]MDI4662124.1 DOPA 4,5-dioxygenase family protein [Cobetia sp. BMC6]NUJ57195.1 DOPA 4,5-dioxygenase family protein [Cobetia marina]